MSTEEAVLYNADTIYLNGKNVAKLLKKRPEIAELLHMEIVNAGLNGEENDAQMRTAVMMT
jgi:hypothetical protein